jgi:DNA polymerase-3 subunit alpha
MNEIPNYIEGKHHPSKVSYLHPSLEDVLRDTHGVIVYQEQILQILQRIAGYTPGEADLVRKAIGKKIEKLMRAEEPKFMEGARAQGLSEDQARKLWELIQPFAGYSFNRAHAACYGLVAYQTAYLKAHYPVEYLSALLTSTRDSKDDKTKYLAVARKMRVEVLPPDVNLSEALFAPDPARPDCVRFGLAGIRNVGEGVVEQILAARREGPFRDFFDFCWRVDVQVLNKRVVESLVKAGAFDSVGHSRGGLLEELQSGDKRLARFEQIVEQIAAARRKEREGFVSLFDQGGTDAKAERTLVGSQLDIPHRDMPKPLMLAFEKEMLGQYVTDHPLLGLEQVLGCQTDASIASLEERRDGAVVTVAGIVSKVGKKFTRKGELMLLLQVEDLEAGCEVVVFPAVAEKAADLVQADKVICVKGRVDHKDDAPKLVAMEVFAPDLEAMDRPMRITVDAKACTDDFVAELKSVLAEHPGKTPVILHLRTDKRTTVLRLGAEFRVDTSNGCVDRLRAMLGAAAVSA